eukprot:TRINITY_DN9233_c0_g1_i1.p1 TRINITY_DN9233_c0_g1~~TRINITY_DN9233_c0_g1_i1.p1  ORF type:complete len:441 (+),score=107.52 TRINITY_DN9233_c0_g1_i1:54-1376(+)
MSRAEVWGSVHVPDVEAKKRQLVIKVVFRDVVGFEARTMKFTPDNEIGQALVEVVSKCEIGKLADLFCFSKSDSDDMLPEDKTFQELGIESMSTLVFKPKPAEIRQQQEICASINDSVRHQRKMFSLMKQGVAVLPSHIRALGGQSITRLDISYNKISVIPPEIGFLTQLRELCLNFNEVTALPAEVGYLTNLEKLYAANNKITRVPPEIGLCTSLKELNLRENQLSSLPRSLGFLVLSHLDQLHLFGNPLHESIPFSALGEGHRAVARFLRNLPQTDAETPRLPQLPEHEMLQRKAAKGGKAADVIVDFGVSESAKSTSEAVAKTTKQFMDVVATDSEINVLRALEPEAASAFVEILKKLFGHKRESKVRSRAFASIAFLLVRGRGPQVERLLPLLNTLDLSVLVEKLDDLPQPQLFAEPQSLIDAVSWADGIVSSRMI